MARKSAGEEPLSEEDPSNPIFKPIPEPSRLESFLITNQVSNFCGQINGYVPLLTLYNHFKLCKRLKTSRPIACRVAGQNFSRLYLTKALHDNWVQYYYPSSFFFSRESEIFGDRTDPVFFFSWKFFSCEIKKILAIWKHHSTRMHGWLRCWKIYLESNFWLVHICFLI